MNENKAKINEAKQCYADHGYALGPVVLPADLIERVHQAMDEVMAGRYDTGQTPLLEHIKPGHDPARDLTKIDQPHLANRTILEAITYPAFGAAIAAITGAKRIQVWAVQMLHKPGGAAATATVGWHQDYQYWSGWWTPESNVFTAWLAISNVTDQSGPMCFVPDSRGWGFLDAGDFFGGTGDQVRNTIQVPPGEQWHEMPGILPPGAFSLHHKLTYHGSHPNQSATPRRSFAVHICTDEGTPTPGQVPGYDFVRYLDDPAICPLIWESAAG